MGPSIGREDTNDENGFLLSPSPFLPSVLTLRQAGDSGEGVVGDGGLPQLLEYLGIETQE
jgi:hypothetical protein